MSNVNDDLMRKRADIYHSNVIRMRAENAEKEKNLQAWELDKHSGKPDRETFIALNGGKGLSEKEISKIATDIADKYVHDEAKAKRREQVNNPKTRKSFADRVREKTPKEELDRAQAIKREREKTLMIKKADDELKRGR